MNCLGKFNSETGYLKTFLSFEIEKCSIWIMEFESTSFEIKYNFNAKSLESILEAVKKLHKTHKIENMWSIKTNPLVLGPGEEEKDSSIARATGSSDAKWIISPRKSDDKRFVTNYIPSFLIYGNCISSYCSGLESTLKTGYDDARIFYSTFGEGSICFRGVYDEPTKYLGIFTITAEDYLTYTELAKGNIWYGKFYYTKDIIGYLHPKNFPHGPKRYFPVNMSFC